MTDVTMADWPERQYDRVTSGMLSPDSDLRDPGSDYRLIDSDVSCVITRFRLRSPLYLPLCYLFFRRIKREATSGGGLVATLFAVDDWHTFFTISIWSDHVALHRFNTRVRSHIRAANWSFGRVSFRAGRPEIWSA